MRTIPLAKTKSLNWYGFKDVNVTYLVLAREIFSTMFVFVGSMSDHDASFRCTSDVYDNVKLLIRTFHSPMALSVIL